MRGLIAVAVIATMSAATGGCAVVSVATTAVDVTTTVVGTAADAGSAVVRGAAHTVSGSSDSTDD